MGPIADFELAPIVLVGWCLQILLIVLILFRPDARIRLGVPGVSASLLAISAGWIYRLSLLFALSSGGFLYWIGDDVARWQAAWRWVHIPGWSGLSGSPVLPGSLVLHSVAMSVGLPPLIASKLVSSTYAAMSLAGLFVFAWAVFRHRGFAVVCVAFWTPFWIDILSSGGTMTEMPVTGAFLAGAGALIAGLRLAPQPKRTARLVIAALTFAAATYIHLSAWIALTGILLFSLPVFLRELHGSWVTRFTSWVMFCFLSTSYCFFWLGAQWVATGSPFTVLSTMGSLELFKIGGKTNLIQLVGEVATPGEIALVATATILLVTLIVVLARVATRKSAMSWRGCSLLAGIAAIACFFAWSPLVHWVSSTPQSELDRFWVNAGIFPASLAYCLFYLGPLVIIGLGIAFFSEIDQNGTHRVVLWGIGCVFMIFVCIALNGGTNLTPFRTVLPLATALVPFALAPFFSLGNPVRELAWLERSTMTKEVSGLAVLLAVSILFQQAYANFRRVESELPGSSALPSSLSFGAADIEALGTWLRSEVRRPTILSAENVSIPFALILQDDAMGASQFFVEYHTGDPARFSDPALSVKRTPERNLQVLADLLPNQILISNEEIDQPHLRVVTRIGSYILYEAIPR